MASNEAIDVFLQPGEYFVGNADYRLRTLLGSCVSITLWHPATRCGGMTHFLLPSRGEPWLIEAKDGRYGDEALDLIVDELKDLGIAASECQAKIFGGGDMFPAHAHLGGVHVGRRNGEAARSLLQSLGIRVASQSLFGIGHRQIIFTLSNGDVWLRQDHPQQHALNNQESLP
jgi:chemotaxis protein CheD